MRLNRLVCLILMLLSVRGYGQHWAELYTSAEQAYQSGEYDSAFSRADQSLSLFLKEIDQHGDNHTAILRLLELICYAKGDYEKGLSFAQKEVALREGEKNVRYAEAMGQVASFQQALEDFEGAEASFRESLAVLSQFYQPDDLPVVEANLNIGINAYNQNKQDEAYSIFKEFLLPDQSELTSAILQASYYFGELSLDRGAYDDAETSFLKIKAFYEAEGLTESTDFAALLISLARISHERGAWDKADEFYNSAQRIYESLADPDIAYFRLLNARAINFQKMHKPEKAEELLAKIPDDALNGELAAIILSNKALTSKVNNDLAAAETYYREALSNLNKANQAERILYCETLQNLAVVLGEKDQVPEALSLLSEAGDILKTDTRRLAALLVKKGIVLLKIDDEKAALKAFDEALVLVKNANREYSSDWVMAMNGIGSSYTIEGNIDSADSVFSAILSAYQDKGIAKDGNYPIVLNNYASVQQMRGQFHGAYNLFFEAAQYLKEETGVNTLVYATTLDNLAHVNINRGMLTVARGQIDSAIAIIEKILGPESIPYASAQITLGRYHQNAGDFPAAEPCFKKAHALLGQLKDVPLANIVRAANALAIFYQTMGNYEEAEPLFEEVLSRIEKQGSTATSDYSTTLQNLATLYQIQGNFDRASELLEKTLSIDEKVFGINHPQYIIALKNLGVLYQKQGKLADAQQLLERALEVTRNVHGVDHPSYAVTVSNLAALYQDQSKYAEAEKAWQQSVDLRKRILGEEHPDYARSLYGLASIYFAIGNLEKADEYFKVVISQYLKQIKENFPFMSEKEKGAFYLKIQPVFESYQDFCIQYVSKEPPGSEKAVKTLFELYDIQLSTKAILLNSTAKVRQQILATQDEKTIETYNKWLATKETIGRYYTLTEEDRAGHQDISLLQVEANELEKELSRLSEIFRSQFEQKDYAALDVKNALADGEAAIEIMRIRKKFKADSVYYVGLVLTKNNPGPRLVIWPDGLRLENRHYIYHRNTTRYGLNDSVSYHRFWTPLAGALQGADHLYVSSDGIFNKVNLTTLRDPGTKHWVLDDYTISLVSNTKEILERNSADDALTNEAHLYGYVDFNLTMDARHVATHQNAVTRKFGFDDIPLLPGTEVEISQIQTLMKSSPLNVSIHMRGEANEESLKKIINPKILHVATHGFFMDDMDLSDNDNDDAGKFFSNPLVRSGLLLAGAGVKEDDKDATIIEDGILTAYEAMNLTLDHTDLVVMSACETGLGEIRNGEGVYGLQRSFLVAGADAVLMSLWQVDDTATQELMVGFYGNWLAGDSKLDAFRKAQISLKEKYPSPYYWGAFIMIGY